MRLTTVLAVAIALCIGSSLGCQSTVAPKPPAPHEEGVAGPRAGAKPSVAKLDPILLAQIRQAPPGGRVNIAVWLAVDELEEPRTATISPEAVENRRRSREAAAAMKASLSERENLEVSGALEGAPILFGAATVEQIERIAERPEVAAIYFYDQTGIDD